MSKATESTPGKGLTRWELNIWSKFLVNIEKANSKKEIAKSHKLKGKRRIICISRELSEL